MFLKSLTLKGFKSFADTTTLELEPGVTVVVGPNGSGKSNVVDAVAWVLGAQGPRTVRSGKMDDVIFAGSANRAALGRAEVSLTIDNGAGLLPVDLAEVTIRRTLFRNGDSEYALNGAPCRLLDVQELLSDSGVGRTQHVIVSQGQLDAVLNASPLERRAVIEEAAGVLKHRKRKERAERRLEATEANLVRLSDLLREVRRGLRPLERQAEAARRSAEVAAEAGAIRLHLLGRELGALRARLGASAASRATLASDGAAVRSELARLDEAVAAAEAELAASGGEDLGEVLVRCERLRARADGLRGVLAERRRGAERDRAVAVDRAVIASLDAEGAALRTELAELDDEAAGLLPAAERVAGAEADLAAERSAFEASWGDGPQPAPVRAGEARAELAALRIALERAAAEVGRLDERAAALATKAARLAEDADRFAATLADAEAGESGLADELAAADAGRAIAESALAEAEAGLRAADGEQHGWSARADALAAALDDARARTGLARLTGAAEVRGVAGTLLDLVQVDEGYEAAFEAAAGAALAAVVVDGGADAARRALEVLADDGTEGTGGAPVLPLGLDRPPTSPPPPVGTPVRAHVRGSSPAVEAALDALLGAAVCVDGGWPAALDAAARHPGAVVVTPQGDRFAPSGWRVGGSGPGATLAALEEAQRRATGAAGAVARAESLVAAARAELAAAGRQEADVRRRLADNDGRVVAASEALARLARERADVDAEAEAVQAHRGETLARTGDEAGRVAVLDAELPALEAEESAVAERGRALSGARAALDERAAAVGALRTELEVRASALEERRGFLTRRLAEVERRLAEDAAARDEAEGRRLELDRRLVALERLSEVVARRLAEADEALADLRERRRRTGEAARATAARLDGLRAGRASAERRLEELRERDRRAELDAQELRLRLEAATATLRRELDVEPEAAEGAPCPPLPEGASAPARLRELEREVRLLGPVNPLALEELTALQERHTFLDAQLEDVKAGRRELAKVIRAVDEEIVAVFVAAFADVAENFSRLFATLFPGGHGRLALTEPDRPLTTGIEVEARPSGKNVKRLSLLSGGERSLTALAYLFAVFRSRPSPFYVMDEVEAALDDVNLLRFLDLVEEFRREAQLLVVTHQKRTMEAADVLYGVTMQPGGSSKVVSERVSAGV